MSLLGSIKTINSRQWMSDILFPVFSEKSGLSPLEIGLSCGHAFL